MLRTWRIFGFILLSRYVICRHGYRDVTHARTSNGASQVHNTGSPVRQVFVERDIPSGQQCTTTYVDGKKCVDCSNNNISSVPNLPVDAQIVNISNNLIERISAAELYHLTLLEVLDISENPLTNLEVDVFKNLRNLSELYIRHSHLIHMNATQVNSLVFGLDLLQTFAFTLDWEQQLAPTNDYVCTRQNLYDSDVSKLTSIPVLEVDSTLFHQMVHSANNSEWKQASLQIWNTPYGFLSFSRNCFQNLQHLKSLKISSKLCRWMSVRYDLMKFDSNSFDNLSNLEEFTLEQLHEDYPPIGWISFKDQMSNITTSVSTLLRFKALSFHEVPYYSDLMFSINEGLSPLIHSDSIMYLEIINCGITGTGLEPLILLPTSLQTIDFSRNCITFNFVTNQVVQWPVRQFIAKEQTHYCAPDMSVAVPSGTSESHNTTNQTKDMCTLETLVFTDSMTTAIPFELALTNRTQCLRYLDLSWNSDFKHAQGLLNFSNFFPLLEYLDLSMIGLLEQFRTTEIQDNLQFLYLGSNNLAVMLCDIGSVMNYFPSLKQISLRDNHLNCLKKDAFSALRNLTYLNLGNNLLETLDFSVSKLINLLYLDLSYNHLKFLTSDNMKDFDLLLRRRFIHVDLSGNQFICECSTQEFLKWMRDNENIFWNFENYLCVKDDQTLVYFSHLDSLLKTLDLQCKSYTWLIVGCCVFFALCLVLLIVALVYRFRWKLRYLYYMTKLHVRTFSRAEGYEQLFEFDAFVSYAAEDCQVARVQTIEYLENRKGLKLCVHERDFQAGETIAFNISKGIHGSRRTLLFLSTAFLASEWCLYELNIARMESMYNKRNVILVVMLEDIPAKDLSLEMVDFIKTYTYMEYPDTGNPEDVDVFWRKCADFVTDNAC